MIKPYYQDENCTIYHGDCRDIMPELSKVDSVITSPPYNLNTRVNLKRDFISRQVTNNEFSTKYKGCYSDNLHPNEYFKLLDSVLNLSLNISKTVFLNLQLATGNKISTHKLLGKYAENLKEVVIWDKGHAQPAMKERTLNSVYENIYIFDNLDPRTRQFESASFKRGMLDNIWRVNSGFSDGVHGATFPKKIVELCVKLTEPQTILDPFMGSGTTLRAAKDLNRKAIGIEMELKYCKIAAERLKQEVLNL